MDEALKKRKLGEAPISSCLGLFFMLSGLWGDIPGNATSTQTAYNSEDFFHKGLPIDI